MEQWHCDSKRGYLKAKKKDREVQALAEQDTPVQSIGLLAQRGVYEFYQDTHLIAAFDGVARVADSLGLSQYSEEIQARVTQILRNYQAQPVLRGKEIVKLSSGAEGIPQPLTLEQDGYVFLLYAALDCIWRQEDGTLHILDFKTGKSACDRRQALVYLLYMSYLYPGESVCASFYNLETQEDSEIITATPNQLEAVKLELARLARLHQQQLWRYRRHPEEFRDIYPPSPGKNCFYCPFNSLCPFSATSLSA
jgi:hypothetical protein